MRTLRITFLWALLLASLGCSRDNPQASATATGSASATATSTARPPPTAGGTIAGTVDVCTVVTAADMAAASGLPIERARPGPVASSCSYSTGKLGGPTFFLGVIVRHNLHISGTRTDAKEYMTQDRSATSGVVKGVGGNRVGPVHEMKGLGDEAYWIMRGLGTRPSLEGDEFEMLVRKGDSIVSFQYIVIKDGVTPDQAAALGTKALPKLLQEL